MARRGPMLGAVGGGGDHRHEEALGSAAAGAGAAETGSCAWAASSAPVLAPAPIVTIPRRTSEAGLW